MNRKEISEQLNFVQSLTDVERAAIEFYTNKGFIDVNNFCRGNKYQMKRTDLVAIIEIIENIIARSPPTKREIVLYRGVHNKYKKNFMQNKYVEDSFVSTSRSMQGAKGFTERASNGKDFCCIIAITLEKGSKILPIEDISKYAHEFEIILPRGSVFSYYGGKKVDNFQSLCVDAKTPPLNPLPEDKFLSYLEKILPFISDMYRPRVIDHLIRVGDVPISSENPIFNRVIETYNLTKFLQELIISDMKKSKDKRFKKIKANSKKTLEDFVLDLTSKYNILRFDFVGNIMSLIIHLKDYPKAEEILAYTRKYFELESRNFSIFLMGYTLHIGYTEIIAPFC